MGIMVYSLLWVMQDLYHQPHPCPFGEPLPNCVCGGSIHPFGRPLQVVRDQPAPKSVFYKLNLARENQHP